MVAKGGTKLINNKAIQVLKKKLINKVSLITPNIPEAEVLSDYKKICKKYKKINNDRKNCRNRKIKKNTRQKEKIMKIDKLNLDGKKDSIEVLDKIFSAKINKKLVIILARRS